SRAVRRTGIRQRFRVSGVPNALTLLRPAMGRLLPALPAGSRSLRSGGFWRRLSDRLLCCLAGTAALRLRLRFALLAPLLHHGARRNFLCPAAVAPRLLGTLLDLSVLALLLLGRTDGHATHLLVYAVPGRTTANPRCYPWARWAAIVIGR